MEIHTIGIDLAKTIFHLVGVNARGEVVVRKKCSRKQLLRFTSNLRVSLIGMEARIGPAIHSESGKLAVFLLERSDESLVLR
jgi:hypothetical protein